MRDLVRETKIDNDKSFIYEYDRINKTCLFASSPRQTERTAYKGKKDGSSNGKSCQTICYLCTTGGGRQGDGVPGSVLNGGSALSSCGGESYSRTSAGPYLQCRLAGPPVAAILSARAEWSRKVPL